MSFLMIFRYISITSAITGIMQRIIIDPTVMSPPYQRLYLNRINSKTVKMNECSVWQGSVSSAGYPQMRILIGGSRRLVLVHRLYFSLCTSTVLHDDLNDVSHLCHNTRCVNIAHLSNEDKSTNLCRRMCLSNGVCHHHHPFPDCKL